MTNARSTMTTFTGKKLNPLDLDPNQICVEDIAHHLSLENRFRGATKFLYTVGQHSLKGTLELLCNIPYEEITNRPTAKKFFFHDASEYILGDMVRPIKYESKLGEEYLQLEKEVQRIINLKFGLEADAHLDPAVVKMDDILLATECRDLMCNLTEGAHVPKEQPLHERLSYMPQEVVEQCLLNVFDMLFAKSTGEENLLKPCYRCDKVNKCRCGICLACNPFHNVDLKSITEHLLSGIRRPC